VIDYFEGKKDPCSLYTCDRCNTDYQIEFCDQGTHLGLALTVWFNLGPGLTPDDPRWQIRSGQHGDMTLDPAHGTESPRAFYENASPRPLKELLSINLSYLKDQRYRKVMRPLNQYFENRVFWCLPSLTNDSNWEDKHQV
jgi:hypothetical protein